MVIGGWARRRSRDFGPFFLYAGLLFASRRSSRRSTCRAGRSSIRRSRSRRSATSSRSRASPSRSPGSPRGGPSWDAASGDAGSSPAPSSRSRLVLRGRRVQLVRPRRLGGSSPAASSWPSPTTSTGPAPTPRPRHVDRRVRDEVLDGPRRGRPRQRPDRHDRTRSRAHTTSRWLVLDGEESVPAAAPILAGNRPAWVGPPLSTGIAGADGLPAGARLMTRREAVLTALGLFVVALARAHRRRLGHRLPEARGHRLLRRGRAQPPRGPRPGHATRCGASQPRTWSSRIRRSRSGCRCRPSWPRSRWRSSAPTFQAAQVSSRPRRGPRAGPGMACSRWDIAAERGLPTGPGPDGRRSVSG